MTGDRSDPRPATHDSLTGDRKQRRAVSDQRPGTGDWADHKLAGSRRGRDAQDASRNPDQETRTATPLGMHRAHFRTRLFYRIWPQRLRVLRIFLFDCARGEHSKTIGPAGVAPSSIRRRPRLHHSCRSLRSLPSELSRINRAKSAFAGGFWSSTLSAFSEYWRASSNWPSAT